MTGFPCLFLPSRQELKIKLSSLVFSVFQLFQRCLIKILNIDLWKLYITYIKDTKGKLPSYRCVLELQHSPNNIVYIWFITHV